MPIISTFTYVDSHDHFEPGLVPDHVKGSDPTSSVAHDILEHFPGNLPGLEGEIQAIGAVVLLRLETGLVDPQNYGDNIAQMLLEPLTWAVLNGRALKPCTTHALADEYVWAEEMLVDGAKKAHAALTAELSHYVGSPTVPYTKDELAQLVLSWLRTGYRKAVKRFETVDLYTMANSLYKKLDRASELIVRSGYLAAGDKVKFTVNIRNHSINAYHNGRNLMDYV